MCILSLYGLHILRGFKKLVMISEIVKNTHNLIRIFLESFNLWRPLLIITLYYQTKTPISFLV